MPAHPLAGIVARGRRGLFVTLVGSTLVVGGALRWVDAALRTAEAPNGIVSFELAGTVETAERIVASWDEAARVHAAFSLGLDFLFLVLYSTAIAWACLWSASRTGRDGARRGPLMRLGTGLAWAQGLAAALDAIENMALWAMLSGPLSAPWPAVARACAVPKFALVGAGLLYAAVGACTFVAGRSGR